MPTPKTVAVMTLWSVLILEEATMLCLLDLCYNFGLVMTNTINKIT